MMSSILKNLSIQWKVLGAFGLVLLLVVGLGLTALDRLSDVNAKAKDIRDTWLPSTVALGQLGSGLKDYRVGEARYLLASGDEERAQARKTLQIRLANVERLREVYEPLIAKGTDDERLIREYDLAWLAHKAIAKKFLSGDVAQAHLLFAEENRVEYVKAANAVDSDLIFNGKEGKRAATSGELVYENTKIIVYSVIAIAILVSAALGIYIVKTVVVPIRRTTLVMSKLAQNDLDVVVLGLDRRDEIGAMASAVQVFKDSMKKSEQLSAAQEEERKAKEMRSGRLETLLRNFESQVSTMVAFLASGSTELEATAQSMSTTATKTNGQATTVAAAAEEASVGVQTVAAAAEQLSASITEISRQVSQSSKITNQVVVDARRTNEIVCELAEGADRIGQVIGLINNIAGQTNLLALNATIEAARAGDAGKGFSVVASEVKELANQTARATQEIAGQIAQIQNSTKEAVAAIGSINGTIEEVGTISCSIASAVEQQGAATTEIARNVQRTATSTRAVTSNIHEVKSASTDTGAAASQVLVAAKDLSRQAEQLTSEVESFLTEVRAA